MSMHTSVRAQGEERTEDPAKKAAYAREDREASAGLIARILWTMVIGLGHTLWSARVVAEEHTF